MHDAVAQIRNFGIVAHINAGKTTLSERILFDCGRVRFLGEVDEGTAALDYLPEEQRRGISIRAASTSVAWRDYRLNLIDTPGHVDFSAEVARSLRVLDGTVLVLDGVRGVEPQTEAVWRQTRAAGLSSIVFVNKLDRPVANWARVLDTMRLRLRVQVLPVVVPIVGDTGLVGLIDVVTGARQEWESGGAPAFDLALARSQLVEAAADFDPAVMGDFVLDRTVDVPRLRAALRRGVVAGQLTLAFAGSALRNRGVEALLDGVGWFLPSPLDRSPVLGLSGGTRAARDDEPVCAQVFRSFVEDDVSLLAVRVYSGRIDTASVLARSDQTAEFTVREVSRLHADHREVIASAGPGDIVALAGAPEDVPVGATLFAPGHRIVLALTRFPLPVLSVALEPRQADDLAAVQAAAQKLTRADPTLALRSDEARGALLLCGIGELHLEIAAERIRAVVGDRFRVGLPEVACRESVRRAAAGHGEWRIAELAARASVHLRLVPAKDSGPASVQLDSRLRGNEVADRLAQQIAGRLRGSLREGWPAFDLEVHIDRMDGQVGPDVDVLPLYVEAAEVALRRALVEADPVVLQPMASVEVTCPHDALSPVLGDLRGKDVDILAIDVDGDHACVRGKVPLGKMLGYSTRLRSLTRGLGSFHLEAAGFAP